MYIIVLLVVILTLIKDCDIGIVHMFSVTSLMRLILSYADVSPSFKERFLTENIYQEEAMKQRSNLRN